MRAKRALFRGKQILLQAERASPQQELSKFGAERQFFASSVKKSWVTTATYCRHFVQSKSYVYLMIASSWLLSLVLAAPMFSPNMATDAFWISKHCTPPNSIHDLPWILYFWTVGFLLPFPFLIVMPIMVMVKRFKSFETQRRRFKEKVSDSPSIMLILSPAFCILIKS